MVYKLLSYKLKHNEIGYGGGKVLSVTREKDLDRGDSCNTSLVAMSSHAGTHIDAQRHFLKAGLSMDRYALKDFIFNRPLVVDCPKKSGQMVEAGDLKQYSAALKRVDLLVLRTGFFRFRSKPEYYRANPGIAPDAARFIMRNPNIRAVGIDTVSVSSFIQREDGRATHRIFLSGKRHFLLIEDMDLSLPLKVLKNVKFIMAVPLLIRGADGSSCTVIAAIETNNA